MILPSCETCKYRQQSLCKRFPPTILMGGGPYGHYAKVALSDSCGEYAEADESHIESNDAAFAIEKKRRGRPKKNA